jgi:hypothetical protein
MAAFASSLTQAQTGGATAASPINVRQAPEGSAGTDPKARLREAAGTPISATRGKGQQLKQAVKEAESDKAAGWSYESDYSACGFLTKPAVRPDGGGLNYHKGGQVLCFQGRIMHCLQGRWRDRGACSAGDSYPPQAWQIEGSPAPGQQPPPDGSPDGQGGTRPHGPDGEAPGGAGLLGEAPLSQQLEAEMRQILERDAELRRQQGDAGAAPGGAAPAGARPGADAAKCAELRGAVAQADEALKQLRAYSRTQRDDGQISSAVRPQYNQIQSARQQAVSMQSQLGCR